MAAITALALVVAVGLILFQVNPQQDTNARNLSSQQRELAHQVHDLNGIICSQAQSTANAYRFRSLTPSGRVEPIEHFLTRMQAQRQTLRLSRGRDCAVAPGFPPFEMQLERALDQINKILSQFSAKEKEPVSREGIGTPNQLQVSPKFGVPGDFTELIPNPGKNGKNGGVGEEGVPYVPPKGKKPKHPKLEPEAPEVTPVERQPRSTPPTTAANEGSETPSEGPGGEEGRSAASPGEAAGEAVESVEGVLCTAIREVHHLC